HGAAALEPGAAAEERRPEHGGRVERLSGEAVDEEKPDGDDRGPHEAGADTLQVDRHGHGATAFHPGLLGRGLDGHGPAPFSTKAETGGYARAAATASYPSATTGTGSSRPRNLTAACITTGRSSPPAAASWWVVSETRSSRPCWRQSCSSRAATFTVSPI